MNDRNLQRVDQVTGQWRRRTPEEIREIEVDAAVDEARVAIDEYYNGDRQWAERWLLKAYEANQGASDHG